LVCIITAKKQNIVLLPELWYLTKVEAQQPNKIGNASNSRRAKTFQFLLQWRRLVNVATITVKALAKKQQKLSSVDNCFKRGTL